MNTVPILLLIFNRPEKTARLVERLAILKPKKIYIGADGPRNDQEKILTDQSRSLIDQAITWECEIFRLYRDTNSGLKKAVSEAITWFFKSEEQGIILEDDCLPEQGFLDFSKELLEKYKHNPKVMHISGLNSFPTSDKTESYHFSNYPRVWGWATWRRAWELYNDSYGEYFNWIDAKKLSEIYPRKLDKAFWQIIIEKMRLPENRMRNSWAYLWALSIKLHQGVCITPNVNLIQNIGFESDATNTNEQGSFADRIKRLTNMKLEFPLKHPHSIQINETADEQFVKYHLIDSFWKRIKIYFKILFPFLKPVK